MEEFVLIAAFFVQVYVYIHFNSTSEPERKSQAFCLFMAITTTSIAKICLEEV